MIDVFEGLLAARLCGGGASPTPPAPEPVLIEKTVTANGTYSAADDDADGYSAVTANVPEWSVNMPLEAGGWLGASGELIMQDNYATAIRIRSKSFVYLPAGVYETILHGSDPKLQCITGLANVGYSSSNGYRMYAIEDKTWDDDTSIRTITEPCYCRFVLRNSDNSNLTVADAGTYVTIRKIAEV